MKFIEELDKESRQAVKQMIATGLYSYKNLHQLKKPDVPETDEVELGEEERDAADREAAQLILEKVLVKRISNHG